MIDGEPEVIKRDGRDLVVDQSGAELVCRRTTSSPSGGGPRYHRVDAEIYAASGTVVPACDRITHNHDVAWLLRRKDTLDVNWNGCSYRACYGDYDPHNPPTTPDPHSGLAAHLDAMTVAEFETATQHARERTTRRTPTRLELSCPACGTTTTVRHTLDGSTRRECPNRRCGQLFSPTLDAEQSNCSGNKGVSVDD